MMSQNVSQVVLPELVVQLCDIFKCTEKSCFSSEAKKYVEAGYYTKDNFLLNNSSFNSENKRKLASDDLLPGKIKGKLQKILKNSSLSNSTNETTNSKKRKSRYSEITSESESSSEVESISDDKDDDEDYSPSEEKKKKPLPKKVKKPENVSEIEIDSEFETNSESETGSESESRSKRRLPTSKKRSNKKNEKSEPKKLPTSKKSNKKNEKSEPKKTKELSEYEKLIQKSRDEKMAFLKSLQIDEIKEEIKKEIKSNKRPVTHINWRKVVPPRKSGRSLTKKKKNLSENFISRKALSEATKEYEKIEAEKKRVVKDGGFYRTRRQGLDSDSEEDINGKGNKSSTKKELVEDFLIPALNDERYGTFLRWTNRRQYTFSIRMLLTNNSVFQDYDKLKGRYHPEEMGYPKKAMDRFCKALSKLCFHGYLSKLPSKFAGKDKKYKLDPKKIENKSLVSLINIKPYQAAQRHVPSHLPLLNKDNTESKDNWRLVTTTFNCDICGAYFYDQYNLKRHIMLHTGERPLSCDVCGQGFFTKDKLNIHNKLHTMPLRLLAGTSGQSNTIPANTVLYVLKKPTNATSAFQPNKMVQSPTAGPNPTISSTTLLTSASLVPQANASPKFGTSVQSNVLLLDLTGTSDQGHETSVKTLSILKPPTDSLKANDAVNTKQPQILEDPITSTSTNLTSSPTLTVTLSTDTSSTLKPPTDSETATDAVNINQPQMSGKKPITSTCKRSTSSPILTVTID